MLAYFWGCQGKARATVQLGRTRSWWRQRRGGSSRRLPLLLDLAKFYEHVRKSVFQRDSWLIGVLHTKTGVFPRPTNAPLLHSGLLGPFFQVAVGATTAAKLILATLLETVATRLTTFRCTWREPPRWCKSSPPKRPGFWKASRRATFLFPRANPVLFDGTDMLKQALLQQLEVLANAQAAGGKKHRSGLSTSSTSHFGLGDGSSGRHSRPRHHAGCAAARLSHLKRPWCGATDAAATFVLALLRLGFERPVGQASHFPQWHEDRPPGSGAEDGGHLGGPGFPFVVRQLCALEPVQGPAVLGSREATPFLGNVLVKLVSRGIWTQERFARLGSVDDGSCQLCVQRTTRHHVPPLLRVPGFAGRKRYVRLSGVAPGGTFSGNSAQGTVCTWHFS